MKKLAGAGGSIRHGLIQKNAPDGCKDDFEFLVFQAGEAR